MGVVRTESGVEFNGDPHCAVRDVASLLGGKWAIILLLVLSYGPKRFNELQTSVGSISQRMLTQTLRQLECDGYVTRTAFAEVPPRVVYELTDFGRSALKVVVPLVDWADENLATVMATREAFAKS